MTFKGVSEKYGLRVWNFGLRTSRRRPIFWTLAAGDYMGDQSRCMTGTQEYAGTTKAIGSPCTTEYELLPFCVPISQYNP